MSRNSSGFMTAASFTAAIFSMALGMTTAGPAAAEPADGWLTSVDEALAVASREDRYVIVDLYAEWCGWCRKLEQQVLSTPAFRSWSEDFVLLWVDVEDGAQGSQLQARFGASSLPTTLVLAPGSGEPIQVGAVTGFHPTSRFIAALDAEIGAWDSLLELHGKVRESGDSELGYRLAQDFHQRGDGRRAAELYEQVLDAPSDSDDSRAWLVYQAADARRLAGDLGVAEDHLVRARTMARALGDGGLVENLDLLSFQIAEARGDCSEMETTLEKFLTNHPRSSHSRQARRTLEEIRQSGGSTC